MADRCPARLRDGSDCGRIPPAGTGPFCPNHQRMIDEGIDPDVLRRGEQPSVRSRRKKQAAAARLMPPEPKPAAELGNGERGLGSAQVDPAEIRRLLAASAGRNAPLLERVLLDALGAERKTCVSVRC